MTYYAVKAGHSTGIFTDWSECQKSINGFSSPDYKKFETEEEAQAFLDGKDLYDDIVKKDIDDGYIVAFCDGSHNDQKARYSYGVVIIDNELNEHEVYGHSSNKKYLSSNNIIGEILGVINAMDWAISNGFKSIKIYHDYNGLSKWVSGEWEAKSDVAKMFVSVYEDKYKDFLNVEFVKVKGHSNNKYNDKADALANKALHDYDTAPINGDSWFSISYFEEKDLNNIIEIIKEEHPEITCDNNTNSNKNIYKLKLNKHKLLITLFKTGKRKILVQGAQSVLFQIFITYINDLIGLKEERIFSDAYRKRIDFKKIDNDMSKVLPTFPTDYPDSVQRLLKQSFINLTHYIECEDYSQYLFPALKALEGHMKYIFRKNGHPIQKVNGFGCFEKDPVTNVYFLPEKIISDSIARENLEKYYNFYNANRHTVFHFGDLLGASDDTRIIETKEETDELIKECINFICEM